MFLGNFIRKNALKLMFFSSLSLLAHEGLASINGAKAVKVKDFFQKKHEAKVKAFNESLNKN